MQRISFHRLTLAVVLVLIGPLTVWLIVAASHEAPTAAAPVGPDALPLRVTFNRHIRPILSDRCFACHGPDVNKRISGLRLDKQVEAFGPMPKHADQRAFVPGHPELSMAFRRITSADPAEVMPPPAFHRAVNAYEQALIKKWIEQGAPWEEHWAFVKPARPQPPVVKNAAWPRNDIDRFIVSRLEEEGLHPSPEADKATLIRRASLDLTGIPPTPAEVDAFLADPSPDAYEKLVDRLLASPRYGEQMATQWLDFARYADSHGYQSDPERHMWMWRDWVINAYNKNMPFDQFTIEQIAGDMLPNATTDQKVATGFNRNGRINGEGGIIPEEWRVETVVDRVETTSATWMGLTMGCCRCHDHKYDPITQKEFYRFGAFFNSINETGAGDTGFMDRGNNVPPVLRVVTAEQTQRMAQLNATITSGQTKLAELRKNLPALEKQWEQAGAPLSEPAGWVARFTLDGKPDGQDAAGKPLPVKFEGPANPTWAEGNSGKAFDTKGDGASINAGPVAAFERTDAFSYGAWVNIRGEGAILSRMDDGPSFRGYDIYIEGGDKIAVHILNQWPTNGIKVSTTNTFPRNKWFHIMVTYDGSSKARGVKIYFNGKMERLATVNDNLSDTIIAADPLLIGRRIHSSNFNGQVADVLLYKRVLAPNEIGALVAAPRVGSILKVPADKRKPEQKKLLEEAFEATMPDLARATADVELATADLKNIEEQIPNTMVMEELPQPRDTHVLIRGQYDHPGEKVTPGVPEILPPMAKDLPVNRLGLARWLVDPANPLTARVQANRLWEKFFGTGIVKTTENFGTQSEWPSHPELIDWLATELVRQKWDLKAFQKLIVTSATYRQASVVTPDLLERDPENCLLARGPRLRLPAEIVRDQALAISGLLVEKTGGPSVRPYEPGSLWDDNRFGNLAKYMQDKGEALYRRSLYTFIKRTAAPPNLTTFDMPSREYCIIKRSRTNTPLQALTLLNDTTYVEAARVFAEHMMAEGGATPAQRIAWAFRRATCRSATETEMQILVAGFEKLLAKYRADTAAANDVINTGDTPRNPKTDPSELAAYSMTASVLLNLDEMVTKQ